MTEEDKESLSGTNTTRVAKLEHPSEESSLAKKRSRQGDDLDDLMEMRKAANRRAAHQSRLRKKHLIAKLQEEVKTLSDIVLSMKENNQTLEKRLEEAILENRKLRYMHEQGSRLALLMGPLAGSDRFHGSQQLETLMRFNGFRGV
jgi:ribosome-binding protein aMBF1 (putative translation factor)